VFMCEYDISVLTVTFDASLMQLVDDCEYYNTSHYVVKLVTWHYCL